MSFYDYSSDLSIQAIYMLSPNELLYWLFRIFFFFLKIFLKIDGLLIVVKESLSTTKLQWPTEMDCLVYLVWEGTFHF